MRKPQLRGKKVGKNTYWYTEANGEAYFGKVGEVPYEDARRHFGDHIKKKQAPAQEDVLTVGGLFSSFLTWVKENRADVQYRAGGGTGHPRNSWQIEQAILARNNTLVERNR